MQMVCISRVDDDLAPELFQRSPVHLPPGGFLMEKTDHADHGEKINNKYRSSLDDGHHGQSVTGPLLTEINTQ